MANKRLIKLIFIHNINKQCELYCYIKNHSTKLGSQTILFISCRIESDEKCEDSKPSRVFFHQTIADIMARKLLKNKAKKSFPSFSSKKKFFFNKKFL